MAPSRRFAHPGPADLRPAIDRLAARAQEAAAVAARSRWAALGLTLVFIGALVATANLGTDVRRTFEGDAIWLLAAVIALYVGKNVVRALRWWLLLREMGVAVSPWATYRASLMGMAVSNLLPTGFAGDPVRLLALEGRVSPGATGALTADRIFDMLILVAMAGLGIPTLAGFDPQAVGPLAIGLVIVVLAVAGVGALVWRRWNLGALARRPLTLVMALGLSVLIQANDGIRLLLIADIYGVDLGMFEAIGIVAIGALAGLFSIVGAGAGVGVAVGTLLAASGASPGAAAAMSLVFVATSLWLSYPLGALAAWLPATARPPDEERSWS